MLCFMHEEANGLEGRIKELEDRVNQLQNRLDSLVMGAGKPADEAANRVGAMTRNRFEQLETTAQVLLGHASPEVGAESKRKGGY